MTREQIAERLRKAEREPYLTNCVEAMIAEAVAEEREAMVRACDIRDGETFGGWPIAKVQATTGKEPIFSGDEHRQRHIRQTFIDYGGQLVARVADHFRTRAAQAEKKGER